MAITKETSIDKIEIVEVADESGTINTFVQVRQKTKIIEDSVIISESFTRYVYGAEDDYSSEPTKLQNICNAAFS